MKQLTSPFYISAEADSWPTGRKRRISAPAYKGSDPINNADIIRLRGKYVSKAGEIFKAIAERCKIFRSYRNEDVGIKFNYSGRSMMESKNKQILRGGPAEDFGKMLTLLPEIIEGAQELEAHGDRYSETVREDKNLKEMHVLLGAFRDGKAWIPVQLEIKEFRPEAKQANKLYVTVTIQTEAWITSSPTPLNEETLALDTPAFVISITELVKNVKDNRGDLLKYLPDSMLSEEQLEIKRTALERDKTKLEEMREGQSVTQGQQMGERYSISGALEEAYRQSLANYDAAAGRLTKADLQSQYEAAIAQAKAGGDASLANALYQELVRVQGLNRDDEQRAQNIALQYGLKYGVSLGDVANIRSIADLANLTYYGSNGKVSGGDYNLKVDDQTPEDSGSNDDGGGPGEPVDPVVPEASYFTPDGVDARTLGGSNYNAILTHVLGGTFKDYRDAMEFILNARIDGDITVAEGMRLDQIARNKFNS